MLIPLTVLPGRVAVCYPLTPSGIVQIPAEIRRHNEEVGGCAAETRTATVVGSGISELQNGDQVIVRCGSPSLSLEPGDYPWVPAEHEIRLYGVYEPVYQSVVGRVV